jgi:hypothetical protein
MEDKRGTKCARSPTKEGSPSPSGAPTPSPTPSKFTTIAGVLAEGLLTLPRLTGVWARDPFRKAPVMNLSSSSDVEGLIPDTSWDEEFTRRLFSDLKARSTIYAPHLGVFVLPRQKNYLKTIMKKLIKKYECIIHVVFYQHAKFLYSTNTYIRHRKRQIGV